MLGYTDFLGSKYQGGININKYKYISMSQLSSLDKLVEVTEQIRKPS